jgi:arabinose-5-phosphate isomerase
MPGDPHPLSHSFAAEILHTQADALVSLGRSLATAQSAAFDHAALLLDQCAASGGTVLVSGLGKSGLVGQKISATLSSLGIPSHSVHPTEAAHGDLGRFRTSDTVICISNSGNTAEVVSLAAILRQDRIPVIAIVGTPFHREGKSALEELASVSLRLGIDREAGSPQFVAPTSSTTATMALGDALALAVARRRGFTDADFARRHPGGSLGGLLRPVIDILRFVVGRNLHAFPHSLSVADALRSAAREGRRPGAMLLTDPATGKLSGLFTDGDLRRLILADPAQLELPIERVMTRAPRTLNHNALVKDAVALVREFRADEVPVVDDHFKPVGVLDVQDLIAMKLVQDEG